MNYNEMPTPEGKMKNKPEDYQYDLGRFMDDIATSVNAEFGEEVLNKDASININQWKRSANFPEGYPKQGIKDDRDEVIRKKLLYSGLSKMADGEGRDKKLAEWEKERALSKPVLLELAVTAVFHKVLGEKFMVVRSSTFDDYENGVDNIIINKETGDVVCAFDEVRENSAAVRKIREDEMVEMTRTEDKEEKIKRKARNGGTKIKYSFGFDNGKLVKKETITTSIPMFYISVEAGELDKLLEGMNCVSDKPNEVELEIFDKLIASLESQVELLHHEDVPEPVQNNILSFEKSLVEIKELRKNF